MYSLQKEEWLIGLVFLIALFLPHSSTSLLMVNPIVGCYLYFRYNKETYRFRRLHVKTFFVSSIIVSIVIGCGIGLASTKSIISAINMAMLIFFFPLIPNIKIRNVFIYIALIYIMLSQVCMFINIPFLSNIYDTMYPISEDNQMYYSHVMGTANIGNLSGFRLAGLFRNPNQCAKYDTLILVTFLMENKLLQYKNKTPVLLLAGVSILMTGSRTGLVIFLSIIFVDLLYNKSIRKTVKIRLLLLVSIVIMFILTKASDFRGLRVDEGMEDSMDAKFGAVSDYLSQNTGLIYFLFGHLDQNLFVASNISTHATLDCEYGYMIFNFGVIGMLCYVLFFLKVNKLILIDKKLIFVPMLWIVSASMLLAYRSVFLYIFLLSKYYVESRLISTSKK